jgi:hypothetical protein
VAVRFFALYVVGLVVGLLTLAGVLGSGVALLLVALGGLVVVTVDAAGRRGERSVDDG